MDNSRSEKPWIELGLTDSEYEKIKEILGRKPNMVELGMFSVMWSEHCSYKNSRPVLKTFPTEGPHVLQGPGENAGVVDIGDGLAVAFKVESHNHPSAIEPYQGAATGVGGIIRDVFTMGARPIALLNSLRFGSLSSPRSRYLLAELFQVLPDTETVLVFPRWAVVYFHPSYEGNPLVNAMCVGILEHKDLAKGVASGVGNPVMVVGANRQRWNLRSSLLPRSSMMPRKKSSQQFKWRPLYGETPYGGLLGVIKTGCVVGMQDMGAAGITSSSCEMATKETVVLK